MRELVILRYFTSKEEHPFDAVAWEVRSAVIMGKDGQPVFEAPRVEFPAFWSQRATDIVASKYFRVVDGKRETSVKQMIHRVSDTIANWGVLDNYFSQEMSCVFRKELTHILLHQYASFNSPVWFNVGVHERPQTSACYILDVEDSMESILEWYRQEGMIFKGGSGSGVNLSKIRAKGSALSNGGVASGVMSFARVADANAGAIKSGGSTRRAAKLLVLDVDHLEIEDFIECKVNAERLAQKLMELGYGNGIEGGAYDQVPWQNANNSVNVYEHFMEDASCNIGLPNDILNTTSGVITGYAAQKLLYKIAMAAWECGDPGLFFHDTINSWHTTPGRGEIVSANPCGEFLRPPNEACNLASLNLLKFLKDDGSFDIPAFTHTVDIMITAMDIMIDRSSYPTDVIAQNSKEYRPLGLGYCNLGALLMAKGLPYDSQEGRSLAAQVTALLTGRAYKQSGLLAEVKGPFAGYGANKVVMLSMMRRHEDRLTHEVSTPTRFNEHDSTTSATIKIVAEDAWDYVVVYGKEFGYRNCQVTVLAPCGTISFMMDCDTTGIEPCLGLVTSKKLVGGGEINMVNGQVARALRCIGYTHDEIAVQLRHICETGLFSGDALKENWAVDSAIFDTALGASPISWQGHIKMVAAVQPFISGGISKTINMPHDATVEDVRDAYIMAWKMGLKAISVYRDGSKGVQPVTVTPLKDASAEDITRDFPPFGIPGSGEVAAGLPEYLAGIERGTQEPKRLRLSDERPAITHKFTINTHEGYLTVGFYPDGRPGELFVRMAKEGSTLGGLMDAWATMMSIALQYGVPLEVMTTKLKGTRYEPAGFTGDPDVRTASSITDYIAQWLEKKFLGATSYPNLGSLPSTSPTLREMQTMVHMLGEEAQLASQLVYDKHEGGQDHSSAPTCSECGTITARNGSCYVCVNCGSTTGCS